MVTDPIVQEVREIRHQIEQEYCDKPRRYYEHLKEMQQRLGVKLVHRAPRLLVDVDVRESRSL